MMARLWTTIAIGLTVAFSFIVVNASNDTLLAYETVYVPAVVAEDGGALPEPTATSLASSTPTPSSTPTAVPTDASTATATQTHAPTETSTPTPTATATKTPKPTRTPEATNTPTPTNTPEPTKTARPTATPTQTPTKTPRPQPTPGGENVTCRDYSNAQICAWVSDATPPQYSDLTTYGRLIVNGNPVAGANMHTIWHYRTTTSYEDCVTNKKGIGACTRWISSATIGYRVVVDVEITSEGFIYKTETSFTPEE